MTEDIKQNGMQQLVQDYLETLLIDTALEESVPESAVPKADIIEARLENADEAAAAEAMVEIAPTTVYVEPEPEPEPQVAAQAAPQSVPRTKPVEAVASAVPLGAQKLADNGMMHCMLVKMHGLNLAIPSDFVETVQNLANVTLQLDADHDWCLGTFGSDSRITLLVDTALRLIPERYDPALAQYNELIILQGRLWALACDELVKSVALPVEKINWSNNDAVRPWLWGTYMEERCIVLNVRQLLSQLNDAL